MMGALLDHMSRVMAGEFDNNKVKGRRSSAKNRLKHPPGIFFEEYITSSAYVFEFDPKAGRVQEAYPDHDSSDGEYTGRFWFQHQRGEQTRMYTEKTAPKWLLVYREEVLFKRGE